jgi:hypothetical protein
MSERTTVYKILSALESGQGHRTLRSLAKEAGFHSAAAKPFKNAFNYLISEGIIKIHKGGWTSERGSGDHQDGVILISSIYRYDGEEQEKSLDIGSGYATGSREQDIQEKACSGRSPHPCAKCKDYEDLRSEKFGTCKTLGWGIDKKLARHHRICS